MEPDNKIFSAQNHGFYGDVNVRDWLAAQAMQGMLANPEYSGDDYRQTAEASYKQADAMIRQSQQKEHNL